MNENKEDQIYKATVNLISDLKKISIYSSDLENPLLNLGKPTHENLIRVSKLIIRKGMIGALFNVITYFPDMILNIFKNIIHHLKYIPQIKNSPKSIQNSKYLFVSHYIGQKISSDDKDSFFGDIPSLIQSKDLKITVAYVNHKKYSKFFFGDSTRILLPKTCSTKDRTQMILRAIGRSLHYFGIGLKTSITNLDKANKVFLLSRIQTNITSFNNEIILFNLMKLVKKVEPKRIIFTLEGHPYELFLARNLELSTIDTKMIFWQVAPVVRHQQGFLETIESLPANCEVVVTGESIRKYILENTSKKRKITVIGSPKFEETMPPDRSRNSILLAPEGSKEAVEEFVTLIPILCKSFSDRKVILRLHPAVSDVYTADFFIKLSDYENFEYSRSKLPDDLERAEYCIYRSSSVSVEALNHGVKPIHFSKFANGELNPLALNNPWIFEAHDSSQLIEIISRNTVVNKESLQAIYNNYYSKLSLERFLQL